MKVYDRHVPDSLTKQPIAAALRSRKRRYYLRIYTVHLLLVSLNLLFALYLPPPLPLPSVALPSSDATEFGGQLTMFPGKR
jgi:hypothetical protein